MRLARAQPRRASDKLPRASESLVAGALRVAAGVVALSPMDTLLGTSAPTYWFYVGFLLESSMRLLVPVAPDPELPSAEMPNQTRVRRLPVGTAEAKNWLKRFLNTSIYRRQVWHRHHLGRCTRRHMGLGRRCIGVSHVGELGTSHIRCRRQRGAGGHDEDGGSAELDTMMMSFSERRMRQSNASFNA